MSTEASNSWWFVEPKQSRGAWAGKAALLFGMAATALSGWAMAATRPEVFVGQAEPVVAAPASAEDRIYSRIQESRYGDGQVPVLTKTVAVQRLTNVDGSSRERSITNPIWIRIDGIDYMVGRNSLSQKSRNLLIWPLFEDVRLCTPSDSAISVQSTRLGVGLDATGFAADNVAVFRNHAEKPVADLCQNPASLADLASKT